MIQLIKVEGDHPEEEVVKIYNEVGDGKPIPDWILGGGGTGTAPPGGSATATQELEEGTYYAFNEVSDGPGKANHASFEVSGEPSEAELPEAQTVTASEYTFENDTLTAGEDVAFENVGQEPHHLIAAPLLPGKTVADAKKFFSGPGKGKPPVDFEASSGTAVLDSDQTVVSDLELKKGKYAFVCFIADRKGGPPHVAKGMITEATVE